MSISTRWTKHLKSQDDKDKLVSYLKENKDLLNILKNILTEDLEVCVKERRKRKTYYMPAWSEYQADCNATERTLNQVIDLITLE